MYHLDEYLTVINQAERKWILKYSVLCLDKYICMMMRKIRFKGRILRSSSDPRNSMPILAAACPFLFPVLPPSSTWKKTQEVGKDYDSFGQGIIASQELKGVGLEGWQAPGGISPTSWTLCPWGGVRPEKDQYVQNRGTGQDSTWSNLSVMQTGGLEAACGFLITFFSSVAQLCPTLCDPMDCSMPGFPVHHQLSQLAQTHVRRVGGPSNHLILCRSLLLLPSIFPSIRVFANESPLHIR